MTQTVERAATVQDPVAPANPSDGSPGAPSPAPELAGVARVSRRIRMVPGVSIESTDPATFVLVRQGERGAPQRVSDWMLELLRTIVDGEVGQDELQATALARGGPLGLFRWVESIRRLDTAGLVEHYCYLGDRLLCGLVALGPGPTPAALGFDPAAQQRVSHRALTMLRPGLGWLAQRPGSHLGVRVGPSALAVLGAFAEWTDWMSVASTAGVDGAQVRAIADQLCRAGVLEQRGGAAGEATTPTHDTLWDPFDWWLHARSRGPRTVFGWAGSYPGRGKQDPLPAMPPRRDGIAVSLRRPDLDRLRRCGSDALVDVMERRRSLRRHDDDHPITVDQLGELLYRTMRIRRTFVSDDGQTVVDGPCPSGGALHELEVYPVVQRCAGLDPGMWHYRADQHELEWVAAPDDPGVSALASAARAAYTMTQPPQVVLVIAARFGRVQWKYGTISYALTLKNTGVLLANLYLVATDMHLAGTAVGSGSHADFARATGLDAAVEGSVGEFLVGSNLTDDQRSGSFSDWEHHGVSLSGDAPGA